MTFTATIVLMVIAGVLVLSIVGLKQSMGRLTMEVEAHLRSDELPSPSFAWHGHDSELEPDRPQATTVDDG